MYWKYITFMTTTNNNEFVMMPVPIRFVPLVTKTLNDAYSAETPLAVPLVTIPPSATNRPWTEAEISRLRPKVSHYKAVVAALDLTSETPGELIRFEQIRERAGLAKGEGAAQLGALTKLVKKEFAHTNWPFTYVYDNKTGRALYRITPVLAVAWQKSRVE
jgi:hypothetical protein